MAGRHDSTMLRVRRTTRDRLAALGKSVREWACNHPEIAPAYWLDDTYSVDEVIRHLIDHYDRHRERRKRSSRNRRGQASPLSGEGGSVACDTGDTPVTQDPLTPLRESRPARVSTPPYPPSQGS